MFVFLYQRKLLLWVVLGGVYLSQGNSANADQVTHIINEQASEEAPKTIRKPEAVFQALNKVSGRSTRLVAAIDKKMNFEDLEIIVKTCQERPPEFIPESATFVKVKEVSTQNEVFSGWMFASAPSLSPFEHPLFDLYLIGCKNIYEKADLKSNKTDLTAIKPAPPRPADLGVGVNISDDLINKSAEDIVDINSLLE